MHPVSHPYTEAQVVILIGYDEQPARSMISHSIPNGLLSISTYPSIYYTLLHFYNNGYDNFILLYKKLYESAVESLLSFFDQVSYNHDMSWTILPVCYEDVHESVHAIYRLNKDEKLTCENIIVVCSSCFTTIVPSLYLKAHRDTNATMTVVLSDVSIEKTEAEKLKKCKGGCFAVLADTTQHNPPIDLLRLSSNAPNVAPNIIQSIYQEIISYNSIYNLNVPEYRKTFENRYLPFLQLPDTRLKQIAASLDDTNQLFLKEVQDNLMRKLPRFPSFVGTLNYFQPMTENTTVRIPFSAIQGNSRMRAYSQPPGIIILAREIIQYLNNISRVWSLFNDLVPFLVEQQNLPYEAQHSNIRAYLKTSPDINICLTTDASNYTRQSNPDKPLILSPTLQHPDFPTSSLCDAAPLPSTVVTTSPHGVHLNKELWSNLERERLKENFIKSIRHSLDDVLVTKSLSDKLKPPRKIIVTGFELTNQRYSSTIEKDIQEMNKNFPNIHCLINTRDIYLRTHLAIKNNLYSIPAWKPGRHHSRSNFQMINYSYDSARNPASTKDIVIDNVMFKVRRESRPGRDKSAELDTVKYIDDIETFHEAELEDHTRIEMSVIGPGCKIGEHVKIAHCVIGAGVVIHSNVTLKKCVIFSNATINQGCELENCTVLDGAEVQEHTARQDVCYRTYRDVTGEGRK